MGEFCVVIEHLLKVSVLCHHALAGVSYLLHPIRKREQAALLEEAAHVLALRAEISP
jgi:hypothetical protein